MTVKFLRSALLWGVLAVLLSHPYKARADWVVLGAPIDPDEVTSRTVYFYGYCEYANATVTAEILNDDDNFATIAGPVNITSIVGESGVNGAFEGSITVPKGLWGDGNVKLLLITVSTGTPDQASTSCRLTLREPK